jgi:hypothetical protein
MNIYRFTVMTVLLSAAAAGQQVAQQAAQQVVQQAAAPCEGLPPGKHSLLERMTAEFGLTCEQELKIEPLLHDEESVTKPLLKFTSLSPEEKQEIMLTIKLAARRQVRTVLTPEQQKGMDHEVESVSKGGGGGAKKGGGKKVEPAGPGLDGEETLSKAIVKYSALTPEEKKSMLLKVKQAAHEDASLQLTAEQRKKLDSEIQELKK